MLIIHYGILIRFINFFKSHLICSGGLLTGNYKFTQGSVESGSRFDCETTQGKRYRSRFWNETYFDCVEKLKKVCEKHGISIIKASHKWLLKHSKLDKDLGDGIIVGASSSEHFRSNLSDVNDDGVVLCKEILDCFDECWSRTISICPSYNR